MVTEQKMLELERIVTNIVSRNKLKFLMVLITHFLEHFSSIFVLYYKKDLKTHCDQNKNQSIEE